MNYFYKSLLLLITAFIVQTTNAQEPKYFHLQTNGSTISSSVFSKVEIVDSRLDTSARVGYINRVKVYNGQILTLQRSLKDELASVVTKLINTASKQEGTLLIDVRKFYFTEVYDGNVANFGEFKYDITCYLKRDSLYLKMFSIDSSVLLSENIYKEKNLPDSMHETVCRFIQQAAGFDLAKLDASKALTHYEIEHASELEKKVIPVYNVAIPKKGLYTSYEDFKNNRPSTGQVVIEQKKGFSRPLIYEMKENGKKGKEILHKYYYVVCDGERMFVSNKYGLYPLTKKDNDFYFTGEGRELDDVYSKAFARSLSRYATVNAKNDYAIFDFMIDHQTGGFLAVRKVKD